MSRVEHQWLVCAMLGADMPSGASTSERYRYVRHLAEGGMGRVELAIREEGRFRRVYAVKRLRDEFLDDSELRAMFLEEARVAGLLRHPNLVGVIDTGEDERGPFLVMDFVEGVPLSALIAQAAAKNEPIAVTLCVDLARQVAEGLHAAHEVTDLEGKPLELVHRDVSPQNIMLGFDGIARLTDFGIAKALGRAHRTTTGLLKGKAGYFSPEQLQFEEPDRRSDVFSLGVVLYELLAARRLYGADTPAAAARRILREPPPDVAEDRQGVHPVLVELLFGMLAKDREHRPADARTVARRLDAILIELALDEDPVRPIDYVNEHFHEFRDCQRRELHRLTKARVAASTPAAEAAHLGEGEPTRLEPARRRGAERPRPADDAPGPVTADSLLTSRARRSMLIASAVIIALGAVAAATWLGGPEPEDAPTQPDSTPEPPRTARRAVDDDGAARPDDGSRDRSSRLEAPPDRRAPRAAAVQPNGDRETSVARHRRGGTRRRAPVEVTPPAEAASPAVAAPPPPDPAPDRRNPELMTWPAGPVSNSSR